MLNQTQYLKLQAVNILNERIEQQVLPLGGLLPPHPITTFAGDLCPVDEYHQHKPLLLAFMRGSWCPYCRGQVAMLDGMAETFKAIGCEMLVCSRETVEESRFQAPELTFISDPDNAFARKLKLCYFAQDEIQAIYEQLKLAQPPEGHWDSSELAVPATFIIGMDGRIVFKHARRDYTQRAHGSEIIAALRSINNHG
ncbi:MAG: redoxin domain-containing protein [Ferrimonas sp.]